MSERPERQERSERQDRRDHRGGRRRKKMCQFCTERGAVIDYKDVPKLRRFVSEKAKILPRRVSGVCARHQRVLTTAIKRARYLALLSYTSD
ncbi:MAG: 30S ribosomal protein S18 [Oscillospiraceae bacterium]|nr:30S ribosomal protein S18 [Oscillospiraceae bacterium]